tara:strand:- start:263 stop:427 length:165 start_codon:yes stop_codon:yes gene_type:complete
MQLLKLQATDKERDLIINALADKGRPLITKAKQTPEEKKILASIENLIKQIAFQ